MAYIFKKIRDEGNEFDISDVEFKVDSNDVTIEDLLEQFQLFLSACHFILPNNAQLDFIEEDV
jgi:hypothetical protein